MMITEKSLSPWVGVFSLLNRTGKTEVSRPYQGPVSSRDELHAGVQNLKAVQLS